MVVHPNHDCDLHFLSPGQMNLPSHTASIFINRKFKSRASVFSELGKGEEYIILLFEQLITQVNCSAC